MPGRICVKPQIDETDARLLRLIQQDAALTAAQLSERLALSTSACHRRLQRLQASGVIDRTVALVNPRAVGRSAIVFVEISLASQADEVLVAFETAVARVPDVLECHLMTGANDYLLKVVARDSEDFARIHRRHLARLPGVVRMQSAFALKTVCATTALPVDVT
ncbi:Leucine-responsive regulatory protein [Jannaschia seosinensis]|uniref:Leucine-responsive regulatory protein n=1 Tax=Jannaschia seosinensis TaxID=313367 RepID=A0A0M7B755_9RHOB|nr:Lrp/AsnC family transcriptional regulator [Jannaschia seosinensis]CUH16429.1 Leucine-responsive regulatory protein [Jannaschia seosinensis]